MYSVSMIQAITLCYTYGQLATKVGIIEFITW